MINGVLTTSDLLQLTGFDREGDLKRALTQAGIRWFPGRGGKPWTTLDLINKAGGLFPQAAQAQQLGPDDV